MITLCQECNVVDGIDIKALPGLSHGLCIDCMPRYLRRNGVLEKDIEELVKKHKEKEVKMTMVEEIEAVASEIAEVPDPKTFKSVKFSSGQDDWDKSKSFGEERGRQIKCAIAGCIGAKYTLTDEPYNFREVVIGGQVVTTKGDGWYL